MIFNKASAKELLSLLLACVYQKNRREKFQFKITENANVKLWRTALFEGKEKE